jgi:hypothetical protein
MKSKILINSLVVASTLMFSGCGFMVPNYSPSFDVNSQLKQINQTTSQKINVGEFNSSGQDGYVRCGYEKIELQNNTSYASYLKNAINMELVSLNMNDSKGIPLTADIKKINLNRGVFSNSSWEMDILFNLNGNEFLVSNNYQFRAKPTYSNPDLECIESANNFKYAIQDVVNSLVNNPIFIQTMNKK